MLIHKFKKVIIITSCGSITFDFFSGLIVLYEHSLTVIMYIKSLVVCKEVKGYTTTTTVV